MRALTLFLLIISAVRAEDSVAKEENIPVKIPPRRTEEDILLTYLQPTFGIRYNLSLGVEIDGGLILGKRSNIIIGPAFNASWMQSGHKYGAGVGIGEYAQGGGIGSVVLRYTRIIAEKDWGKVEEGNIYNGIELVGAIAGAAGGYSLSIGAYREGDNNNHFFSVGIGIGM